MSARRFIATIATFGAAACAAGAAAWYGAAYIETSSREAITEVLAEADLGWATVDTDGLQLILGGRAPDEPARFRAITRASSVVDPGRIIDAMDVQETQALAPPRFSLEILRNDDDVSVIGLIPARGGPELLTDLLDRAGTVGAMEITNMVETSDHEMPSGWEASLRFAVTMLRSLPRSKVSVEAGAVSITAVADSDEERIRLERALESARPIDVDLAVDIAAPRPVIAPFTLRFVNPPEAAARFEACAVDTEAARDRVLAAAADAGYEGTPECVVALGVPSARWGEAAALGIDAIGRLGGGALTLSDADVSLIAPEGTERAQFDTIVAELGAAMPDLFVLTAVLPEPTRIDGTGETEDGPPEFVATLSPEGQVQLRGRLFDEAQQTAVVSYGRALFGVADTYMATRRDPDLPRGWPGRVLASLDALSFLASGTVVVQPDLVAIRGVTGRRNAEAGISGLLSDKLGADADFRIEVTYDERLDPLLNIPTPQECVERLNAVLLQEKLTFAPGEAVIEEAGDGQLSLLKDTLDDCDSAVFEIGGHTDSQGSEGGNLSLSVGRATAVRDALIARGASPVQLVARGYGEAEPIADNDTEEGREANRRITFTLLSAPDDGSEASIVEQALREAADALEVEAALDDAPETEEATE